MDGGRVHPTRSDLQGQTFGKSEGGLITLAAGPIALAAADMATLTLYFSLARLITGN